MGRRGNELKPGHGEPGYQVTRTDEYEYSPSPEGPSLALVGRRRCNVCIGECRVVSPRWKAWSVEVGLLVERMRLAGATAHEPALRRQALQEAGAEPAPKYETCPGCDGRGWNEVEVTLREVARELAGLLRVKMSRKGNLTKQLEVTR